MKHVIVNGKTCPDLNSTVALLEQEICEYDQDLHSKKKFPRALVIDGPSITNVMGDDGARKALIEFGRRCNAVVGCRVSPDDKKNVVTLIKNGVQGVRTLAIGDGANDVAMIQAAHVGVGIKGEEGLQAVTQ